MKREFMDALRLGAGVVLLSVPLGASAFSFELGQVDGSFDTVVSVGATMRMEDRDAALVGIANGGTARTVNEDDGNLGFEKNDLVLAVAKSTHDLVLKWRNFGVLSRVNLFYDDVAAGASHREDRFNPDGTVKADRAPNDYELGSRGRDRLELEADLLDLFAYGSFNVGERSLSARFGKQVVSWGESTFIGNGINSINPIDVAKIRTPGAELKEALIPTAMLWGSMQLNDKLSFEAVWQTAYQKTEIDPRGSFFSSSDIASDDSDRAIVSFGRREDDNLITRAPGGPGATNTGSASVWVPRQSGPKTEDGMKQFGAALHYFAEALGNTEFGLYFLTYHSRTPLLSVVRGGGSSPGSGTTNSLNLALPTCSADASNANCRATYFTEYPDNIELYGMSFNTDGPAGIAIQGEYSYRPNQPIQISGTELILATLGLPNSVTGQGFTAVDTDGDPNTPPTFVPDAFLVPRGTVIRGFDRVHMHQAQSTLTKAFGPTIGADQFVLLGEVGVTWLDLPSRQYFSGPGAALPGPGSGGPIPANPAVPNGQADGAASGGSIQREGFADRTSWGYRMVGRMDFESVIGAGSLSPRLVWAHDVNGVGPSFNQDTKAITAGLSFNYLQRWGADLAYTSFFGGRTYSGADALPAPTSRDGVPQAQTFATSANPSNDRDFLSLSVSYAF
jgi:hypothetical protein